MGAVSVGRLMLSHGGTDMPPQGRLQVGRSCFQKMSGTGDGNGSLIAGSFLCGTINPHVIARTIGLKERKGEG